MITLRTSLTGFFLVSADCLSGVCRGLSPHPTDPTGQAFPGAVPRRQRGGCSVTRVGVASAEPRPGAVLALLTQDRSRRRRRPVARYRRMRAARRGRRYLPLYGVFASTASGALRTVDALHGYRTGPRPYRATSGLFLGLCLDLRSGVPDGLGLPLGLLCGQQALEHASRERRRRRRSAPPFGAGGG